MKTFFITGISTGLGQEIAVRALKMGHYVIGTTRSQQAANEFEALGDNTKAIVVDLNNEEEINNAIKTAEAINGKIDILINNAGYGLTGAIEEVSQQQIKDLFAINVFAPIIVIRAALPQMRALKNGHIINIGSVSGLAAWMGTGIYGASKFALECISRTLSQEVSPLGIKVTSVAPGGMRTDFSGGSLKDAVNNISDYDTTAHEAHRILTGHKGQEPNDTGLSADAILEIAGIDEPPTLLLLGADAFKYAEYEIASIQKQMETWKDLTLSTVIP